MVYADVQWLNAILLTLAIGILMKQKTKLFIMLKSHCVNVHMFKLQRYAQGCVSANNLNVILETTDRTIFSAKKKAVCHIFCKEPCK